MAIPKFGYDGDLPPGIYHSSLEEVEARLGRGTLQRRIVFARLRRIYELVVSTGHLKRFVLFGSFVTAKAEPNDVDIVIIMEDNFDLSAVVGEANLVFRHGEAAVHFGASIFWTSVSGALGGEEAMIEFWQTRRDGGKRGIIEIDD